MSAVWMRMRSELRSRWRAWLGLALLFGLFGGAIIAAAAGARRTDSAYPRFLKVQNAYDSGVPLGFFDPCCRALTFDEVRSIPVVATAIRFEGFPGPSAVGMGASPDARVGYR